MSCENTITVKKNNRYIRSTLCYSSVQEKKIILLAISKIDEYKRLKLIDEEKPVPIEFVLSALEIKEILDVKSNDIYKQLKNTCSKILSRSIYLQSDNTKEFCYITPFPYAKYSNGKLTLRSEIAMFDTLVNYNDKSGFTQFLLANLKNIRSSYSIEIYEVLRSYLYQGKISIEVDKLKEMIGVYEIVPINPRKPISDNNKEIIDKLPAYGDFKRRVLNKAQEEINTYTDIEFDYEEKKIGNKVTTLVFSIQKNSKNQGLDIQIKQYKRTRVVIPKERREQVEYLKSFLPKTTKNKDLLELLDLANDDVVKIEKMYQYTMSRKNKVRSVVAYIKKGLKDGWEVNQEEFLTEVAATSEDGQDEKVVHKRTNNRFNDFPQRDYTKKDYDQLELALMNLDYFSEN